MNAVTLHNKIMGFNLINRTRYFTHNQNAAVKLLLLTFISILIVNSAFSLMLGVSPKITTPFSIFNTIWIGIGFMTASVHIWFHVAKYEKTTKRELIEFYALNKKINAWLSIVIASSLFSLLAMMTFSIPGITPQHIAFDITAMICITLFGFKLWGDVENRKRMGITKTKT